MKVLPVSPEFKVSFWSYKYALEKLGKKASMPPLGLATVVAMLPQDHFDVQRIIDMNVEPLTDRQTDKKFGYCFYFFYDCAARFT